jgi:NadR type nicotinamide-nucleotide adenylyltransferase
MIRKVAVTGPESTGKSELAAKLASHYQSAWVPEYSREYLEGLDQPYRQSDILEISKGQIRKEEQALQIANKVLFCDTELIVNKIWSDVIFHSCDPWILQQVADHRYDLYLLCWIDVPWTPDPLREHPHYREALFDLYYKELKGRGLPFEIVCGLDGERLQHAIKYIQKWFEGL